jgi:hypothetical protein
VINRREDTEKEKKSLREGKLLDRQEETRNREKV